MKTTISKFILFAFPWLLHLIPELITAQSDSSSQYRAARYSTVIEHSVLKDHPEFMPYFQSLPLDYVAYKYFVQYGPDTLIEIIDASNGPEYLPVFVEKRDFTTQTKTTFLFFKWSKEYTILLDSIPCAYEENSGSVRPLCNEGTRCDTLMYTSNNSKSEYAIHFDKNIYNLPSQSLFYPDVQYLPIRVVGSNGHVRMLDEFSIGKPAVDSLLSFYKFENYRLNPNDLEYYKRNDPEKMRMIMEFIEKVQKMYSTKKD